VKSSIEQAFGKFLLAFNAMDVESLGQCFAREITLFAPAGAPSIIEGANEVLSHFNRVFAEESSAGPSVRPVDVRIVNLSPDAAAVTFEFARAAASIGRRTFIYQRIEDEWKVVHIHASNRALEDSD